MASGEQLVDSLKAMWNEAVPNRALNYKDDHILAWFIRSPNGQGEWPLYIHVLHAGMEKNWGSRQNEILCLILTETVATQLTEAYPDQTYYYGVEIRWDHTLPERHKTENPNVMSSRSPVRSTTATPPFTMGVKPDRRTPGHVVSFAQIWNPGNQLGYGWRCSCDRGMLCAEVIRRSNMKAHCFADVLAASKDDSHFTIALPLYGKLIHRVGVTYIVSQNWEGEEVQEFSITIPTGLGEQSRFYTADDWQRGLVDPIDEIVSLITVDMLANTAEGKTVIELSENYAAAYIRSNICVYSKHTIGTNMALQTRLKTEFPLQQTILANAFTLLHYGMCLVCATNNELALMVPSQV